MASLDALLRRLEQAFAADDDEAIVIVLDEVAKLRAVDRDRAPSAVLPYCGHPSEDVRTSASCVLAKTTPARTAELVMTALADEGSARCALGAISAAARWKNAAAHFAKLEGEPAAPVPLADALVERGVVSALMALAAKSPRDGVLQSLGGLASDSNEVLAFLTPFARHEDSGVRRAAAWALRPFGDRAIPVVEPLLDDFGEADSTALRVLTEIGSDAAFEALVRFAARGRGEVAAKARAAVKERAAQRVKKKSGRRAKK